MFNARRRLGLAVTEQGITAVEIATSSAGRRTMLQSAVLPFSDGINLDQPEKLGKELRKVLRASGVRASRCVIGLAAAWIAARGKVLPATDPDSLRGALSIAAEHEFASGPEGLVFDYAASPGEKGSSALLVAAPRQIIEQSVAMARAARLSVLAITSSTAALALATRGPVSPAGRLILGFLPRGVELAVQSANGVRLIRHVSARLDRPGGHVGSLSAELRRILLLAPAEQEQGPPRELLLWDSAGADRSALESLEQSLGAPVRFCTLATDLGVSDAPSTLGRAGLAQAAALACSAGQPLAIDFLHSHLAPPAKTYVRRRAVWAAAASLLLIAAVIHLLLDWRAARQEVLTLQGQLADLRPAVQEARTLTDNVTFARGWYDRRPEFLNCLREITLAFPEEGRVWAAGVTIREDMQALLSAKSVNEAAALEVLDRLKSNPRLANVKPLFIRQAGGTSRDVSFAISLSLPRAD
ncbi:MAG: hypothetical protein ABIF82_05330 [Planctomycetota bacterium]